MAPLLDRHRPDLLIEVLPFALDALSETPALRDYDNYLLLPEGPVKAERFEASSDHRGCCVGRNIDALPAPARTCLVLVAACAGGRQNGEAGTPYRNGP
jgi:hypothetical protein